MSRTAIELAGGSDARGRNGWFHVATADVSVYRGGLRPVVLDLWSKRRGDCGAVVVELTPADAKAIAWSLLDAAKALDVVTDEPQTPVCLDESDRAALADLIAVLDGEA